VGLFQGAAHDSGERGVPAARQGRLPAGHQAGGTESLTGAAQAVAAACAFRSSLLRRFTLSDLSCPQAAMMSSPRGVRTGEEYPAALTMSEKALIAASLERSKGAPGHGLNGIRLTLAGMPARRRTSALASAGLSLTPFSMTYSKVMRRALLEPGYVRQAWSSSASGYFLLSGTSTSRSSSVTACSEIARLTPSSAPQ